MLAQLLLTNGDCMPLEVKLSPKLTYKLRLNPQMKLSLNLLQLPMHKLKEYLIQEIEKNPLLESPQDHSLSMNGKIDETIRKTENQENKQYDFDIPETEDEEQRQYQESLITQPATLREHLLKQIQLLLSSKTDLQIGEYIIGNINENGYFTDSVEEVAKALNIDISKVKKILSFIQTLEPIGIGAQDLRECLLLQLKAKGKENFLEGQIVNTYLPYLEKKRFEFIARKLKCSVEKVKDALKEISKLSPKPGCSFTQETIQRLIPDAILTKNKGEYEVTYNDWELPRININSKYKELIKQKTTPEDTKEYLRGRLNAACSLIYAINKRKETIQKIVEEIKYAQRDFFDNGADSFKPMSLSQIANRVGKHKSTISRALVNKYLQTPNGIFELRYFLNSGVKQGNRAEFFSSKAIKSKIKTLVESENKKKPLSDQEIVKYLGQKKILVSRRTIAKYRHQLKILPSKSRRE